MSSKLKTRLNKTEIILLLIIVVLFIIFLTLLYKTKIREKVANEQLQVKISQNNNSSKNKNEQLIQEMVVRTDDEIVKMLSNQDLFKERDRIEYYCGEYFKKIDEKDYVGAYNMLYEEFKAKYFPTVEEFEEYIKKTYPDEVALEYVDITRQGNIYVLKLTILDVLGTNENEKSQRIVIRENDYNRFDLSFQVI